MPKVNKKAGSMPDDLRRKVAASMVKTQASLVPPGIGENKAPLPPPRKEETAPKIDEVMEDGEDKDTLRELVRMYSVVNGQKKAAIKQLKPIGDRIKPILSSYGINQLVCDNIPVNYFVVERRTINKGKLIAAGVSIETIEACTDVKPSGTLKIGDEEE